VPTTVGISGPGLVGASGFAFVQASYEVAGVAKYGTL
jgi:hypothetical protein